MFVKFRRNIINVENLLMIEPIDKAINDDTEFGINFIVGIGNNGVPEGLYVKYSSKEERDCDLDKAVCFLDPGSYAIVMQGECQHTEESAADPVAPESSQELREETNKQPTCCPENNNINL